MTFPFPGRLAAPLLGAVLFLAAGCAKSAAPAAVPEEGAPPVAAAPDKIRFKTDWFPQAEHGGFYQALVKGYYRDAHLDVDVVPGGPGVLPSQLLLSGTVDLAMGRSDDLVVWAQQGLPLIIVGVYMEHDPQGLLLHEEDPAQGFADLDHRTVMVAPGVHWLDYIVTKYHLQLNQIPLNFGLAQFMADKRFIQQCFVTDEPYYVRKNGGHPKTFLLSESGYNPYRVIFGTQAFVKAHPDAVRRFVAASLHGWDDYMKGDPTEANAMIIKRNQQMDKDFIAFSAQAMLDQHIVYGKPELGERLGLMTRKRMQEQADIMLSLKIVPVAVPLEKFVRFDLLPADLQADAK
jgi:NitT/TauT family transport system substrate-binding protein